MLTGVTKDSTASSLQIELESNLKVNLGQRG